MYDMYEVELVVIFREALRDLIRERWTITKEYKCVCTEMMQDNLASLRAKATITQEEISNVLGCSRQTYYALETKQREMSWGIFLELCFFYHNLNETREMLNELKIYPIELFVKFNEEMDVVL